MSLNQLWTRVENYVHWHTNEFLTRHPGLPALFGCTLTVEDAFGTPGDTLMTATVCRELKRRHPALKINCVTKNPGLLLHDPNIQSLNAPEGLWKMRFWYLDLLARKERSMNVLAPTMAHLGIQDYQYRACVYLTEDEKAAAAKRLAGLRTPIVTINAMSRQRVKEWPVERWQTLTRSLSEIAGIVQLGDEREPVLDGVFRLAGTLSMRESMGILSHASAHIGPDSFLMHAANGLDVPSVIIFGGSRPPEVMGYKENVNLGVKIECGPCWIHDTTGEHCPYNVKCMDQISPETVLEAVKRLLSPRSTTKR